MIPIITDLEVDSHAKHVSNQLSKLGENTIIYNPTTYPLSSVVTIEYKNGKSDFILSKEHIDYDLSQVKSVWYRRPGDFSISSTLKTGEKVWLRNEYRHFFNALWMNLRHVLWVNNPENNKRAGFKLFQLSVAAELEFHIPPFIVTNDIERAKRFIEYNKEVVIKSLASPSVFTSKRVATIYTHLLKKEDLEQLFSVRFGPTFLQKYIRKKNDIRVTIIGNSLFAAKIDPSGFEEAYIDFRKVQPYDLIHEQMELPNRIKKKCIKMVKYFGLHFAAIDLLLTPNDDFVFLEINPNGQWLWIEEMTGMPLTKAMCNLLSYP